MKPSLNSIKDKPNFISDESVSMLTVMGSRAYGTETPESDWDFYGVLVPPVDVVFPHLKGRITGFGKQVQEFNQSQGQHLENEGGEFDVTIYNITRYFQLCMDGNPNMIDSLFTGDSSLVKCDNVGKIIRENRQLFLSQKCYHTFKGMAFSHMCRLNNRERIGKRAELINQYGYDVKDASHIIRLVEELKMILTQGDLDLKANSTLSLGVKQGLWKKEEVVKHFEQSMEMLDAMVESQNVSVPYSPDEGAIKRALEFCLEEKYGNLSNVGYRNLK